jgi:hypothetical protein
VTLAAVMKKKSMVATSRDRLWIQVSTCGLVLLLQGGCFSPKERGHIVWRTMKVTR